MAHCHRAHITINISYKMFHCQETALSEQKKQVPGTVRHYRKNSLEFSISVYTSYVYVSCGNSHNRRATISYKLFHPNFRSGLGKIELVYCGYFIK
jgi:hypothetical protein